MVHTSKHIFIPYFIQCGVGTTLLHPLQGQQVWETAEGSHTHTH